MNEWMEWMDIPIIERDWVPEGQALVLAPPLFERNEEGTYEFKPRRVARIVAERDGDERATS